MKGLELWDKVSHVDRSYTKPITGREFTGNSVNLTYTTMKLTEALGPAGDRWGWEVMDEKVHEYGSHEQLNFTAIHSVRVRLWVLREDGSTGHIEDYGTTKLAYYAGQGSGRRLKVDEEACKKSISDAKSKLFVALGGSAELWLGEFDRSQHKYIGDEGRDRRPRQPRQPPADERARGFPAREPQRPAPADHHGDDRGEPTYRLGGRHLRWPDWVVAALDDAKAMDADDLRAWWSSDAQRSIRRDIHRRHPDAKGKLEALKAEVMSLLAPLPEGGDPEKAREMSRNLGA